MTGGAMVVSRRAPAWTRGTTLGPGWRRGAREGVGWGWKAVKGAAGSEWAGTKVGLVLSGRRDLM